MKKINNSGQALLIVLLSMAVVLTIVLSVLSRSVSDISISSKDEDSLRAFSAAEAGVERALVIGSSESSTIGEASYNTSITSYVEGEREYKYPSNLFSGESATVWFINHDDEGNYVCSAQKPCFTGPNIRLCWGRPDSDPGSSTAPAIEVTVFYTSNPYDLSTAKVARMAVDPNDTRKIDNSFSDVRDDSCTVNEVTYPYNKFIRFENDLGISNYATSGVLQFAQIRFLYNTDVSSPLAVLTPVDTVLPSQGTLIDSLGTSGDANRKVSVFKHFSEVPDVFYYGAYTSGNIVK